MEDRKLHDSGSLLAVVCPPSQTIEAESSSEQAVQTETSHEPWGRVPTPPDTPSLSFQKKRSSVPAVSDTSSVYLEGWGPSAAVSPLRITKAGDEASAGRGQVHEQSSILRDYATWRASALSSPSHTATRNASTFPPELTSGKKSHQISAQSNDAVEQGGANGPSTFNTAPGPDTNTPASRDVFIPFPWSWEDEESFAERKDRKVPIGNNGWLKKTSITKPIQSKKAYLPKKASCFFDVMKKTAKNAVDMTEKMTRRVKSAERDRRPPHLRISLDPREQSFLYCKLEFLLTSALDDYLHDQFTTGRLEVNKYKKIVDHWQRQGRPKVVGFRYDLETQLNLVHLHLNRFKFNSYRSSAPVSLGSILDKMKIDARAMRIRTFCQPDSVIVKQMSDSQRLLHIIGSPENQKLQLAEIVQFFQVTLDRARNHDADTGPASLSMAHQGNATITEPRQEC